MLIRYYIYNDPRGCPVEATPTLIRDIAIYKSLTRREVIEHLRAGFTITCGWWRYRWEEK